MARIIWVGLGFRLLCRYSLAMHEDNEKRIAAHLAKVMAMRYVRNTELENIHAGLTPTTRTGDYLDAKVTDADGRKIPWPGRFRILTTTRCGV